jgi:hypothetical protein
MIIKKLIPIPIFLVSIILISGLVSATTTTTEPLFDQISGTLGAGILSGIFGSTVILAIILFIICIGICLKAKMSFDGIIVVMTILGAIEGIYFAGAILPSWAIMGIIALILGIIVSVAAMKWVRR